MTWGPFAAPRSPPTRCGNLSRLDNRLPHAAGTFRGSTIASLRVGNGVTALFLRDFLQKRGGIGMPFGGGFLEPSLGLRVILIIVATQT